MDSLQERPLTTEDGIRTVELAREALETYVKQDKRVQLGRQDEIFYERTGVFVQLRSGSQNRLKGSAAVYRGNDQLLDALVDGTIRAASDGYGGTGLEEVELTNTRISLALVERVLMTDTPVDELTVGEHMAVVGEEGWMFPQTALEQEWSPEEYLSRVCRKAGDDPSSWEEGHTTLLKVRTFEERKPRGYIKEVDPETYESDGNSRPGFTSYSD